ncbi:MAG: hypothetical protein U0974_01675 [Gemmatimonadales bacterium]|nr:hypothetical protein [Gemmatimonadales bacterium]MDZ4388426.1 hypothetical protein [Gemmatimonadales bacterium]
MTTRTTAACAAVLLVMNTACAAEETKEPAASAGSTTTSGVEVLERGANCGDCEIELEELYLLGHAGDSLPIGDGSFLTVAAGDRCIVGPTDRSGEALIFDECRGEPRQLGRRGEGPGELSSIRAVAPWRGDSVVFLGYGRLEILSSATGGGRSLRFDPSIEGYTMVTVPGDSAVIVNNSRPTKSQFAEIRWDGSGGTAFGLPGVAPSRGDSRAHIAALGSSPRPHAFWSGPRFFRHHLTLWSRTGEELFTVDRSPAWFAPYDSSTLAAYGATSAAVMRPVPSFRAVHESDDGLLWTAFVVAAHDWRPDSVPPPTLRRTPGGEVPSRSRSRMEHFDGVIEVLDAASGEFLMSVQTDELWVGFANDSLVYSRRQGEDGTHQIAVYRMRLRRSDEPRTGSVGALDRQDP